MRPVVEQVRNFGGVIALYRTWLSVLVALVTGVTNPQHYGVNAYGLHDTAGNVVEWVQDCKHPDYAGAPVNGQAWMAESGGDCSQAVLRGGSWLSRPGEVRLANRSCSQRS